ncbi:glycosyltransferase [Microbacterium sp.]|uniref:glycosyltransferase n=1 Tax=Microbacterium sp. TaxID=51671 RepID=UPI0028118A3C|nr:glycosyltransferase [Microbacterium sp.]
MTRQFRSLHLADTDGSSLNGGGAEIIFDATVRAARDLGHDVTVMTADPIRTPLSYVYSRRHYRSVLAILERSRPDLVHLQNYYHFLSPSVLAAIREYKRAHPSTRVVFTAHDFHLICPNSGFQHFVHSRPVSYDVSRPRFRWFHKFDRRSWAHSTLKLAQHVYAYRVRHLERVIDAIISPSELIASALRNAGVTIPVHVLRNPISVGPDKATGPRSGLAFLGRLTPAKGLLTFAEMLEREGVSCRIDVYGDGPQRNELVDFAGRSSYVDLALHGHVRHDGIADVLGRHTALVYPSTWIENAPLAVVEAAALGLSLVVPHQGGAREMAELAEQHHFYDPAVPASAARAVRDALATAVPNRLRDPGAFRFDTYVEGIRAVYRLGDGSTALGQC